MEVYSNTDFWRLLGICVLAVAFAAILYSISCLDIFLEKCREWLEKDDEERW